MTPEQLVTLENAINTAGGHSGKVSRKGNRLFLNGKELPPVPIINMPHYGTGKVIIEGQYKIKR